MDSTETNSSSYFVIGKICQRFFFSVSLRLFLLLSCSPSLAVYLYLQSLLRGSGFYLFLVVHLSLITLHQLAATWGQAELMCVRDSQQMDRGPVAPVGVCRECLLVRKEKKSFPLQSDLRRVMTSRSCLRAD